MTARRRLPVTIAALLAAVTVGFTAAPAEASVATNFCDPHAYTYIVKNYTRGAGVYTMRCGETSWGFRHLVARGRWNATFDSWIALTIAHGADVADVQNDGGS